MEVTRQKTSGFIISTPRSLGKSCLEQQRRSRSVDIRCNGLFTYKICDPLLFYTNVCGNVADTYESEEIAARLKGEMMTALQPALAKLSAQKIQYYEIPAHTLEISDALNEVLSSSWRQKRGIEVFSVNINSLSIPDDQRKKLTEWEENAMTTNPNTAAARLVGGQIDAAHAASRAAGAKSDSENAAGRQLDLHKVRNQGKRKVLSGVWFSETCRRVDLLLWCREQGKILYQLRSKETGRGTSL